MNEIKLHGKVEGEILKEDFNYDDRIAHKIIYQAIDEFEEWIKTKIEEINKLEYGISEKEMYIIKKEFLEQWIYTYCCTFATIPMFMVDENERLQLERLKSDFEVALALARSKYKSKITERLCNAISKIIVKIKIILLKLF
jgi:hypothetical protein